MAQPTHRPCCYHLMHSVATLKAESEDDGGNEAEKENKKDPKASKLAKTVRVLRKVQKEQEVLD